MSEEARQYALALFALAEEGNSLPKIQNQMNQFVLQLDQEVRRFMRHPGFSKDEKKKVISSSQGRSLFTDFLFVLIDNERFDLISEIQEAFEEILLHRKDILKAKVYSKTTLTPSELERIRHKIEKDHRQKVELENILDASILAGTRIEYEGYIHDATASRQLTDLASELYHN